MSKMSRIWTPAVELMLLMTDKLLLAGIINEQEGPNEETKEAGKLRGPPVTIG